MAKFDHMSLTVSNWRTSRDWYVNTLGLEIEMENEAGRFCAVRDADDFAIFLGERDEAPVPKGVGFWFKIDDVDAFHADKAAKGVHFVHPPQKTMWGYGAELADPDGYAIYVWDEASMKAKG